MKKVLLGNFKMNMTKRELVPYLKTLRRVVKNSQNIVGVAIPNVYLCLAQKYLAHSNVLIGAQNVHFENKGAYTGEVGANMLSDYGVNFCLIGHSERRAYNNENNIDINKKLKRLTMSEIVPVLCFGESAAEREVGRQFDVVTAQLCAALEGLTSEDVSSMVFAYEPVWAIGSGASATTMQICEMSRFVKDFLTKTYGIGRDQICLLYGGSLNDKNFAEIFDVEDINGGLIGGACLDIEKFGKMIKN